MTIEQLIKDNHVFLVEHTKKGTLYEIHPFFYNQAKHIGTVSPNYKGELEDWNYTTMGINWTDFKLVDYFELEVVQPIKLACSCNIVDLMKQGCNCGHLQRSA